LDGKKKSDARGFNGKKNKHLCCGTFRSKKKRAEKKLNNLSSQERRTPSIKGGWKKEKNAKRGRAAVGDWVREVGKGRTPSTMPPAGPKRKKIQKTHGVFLTFKNKKGGGIA